MERVRLIAILAGLIFVNPNYAGEKKKLNLSTEAIQNLQSKGFKFTGMHRSIPPLNRNKDEKKPESDFVRIDVSLDLSRTDIQPVYMGSSFKPKTTGQAISDTILVEDFEGAFPGTAWQLSGNPTWGKTDYQKRWNSQYSVWCAAGGDSAKIPGASYPNNLQAMMVYGPFDLSDVNYGELNFWFWLDAEREKDWFYYMVSTDGNNFSGVGVSGQTGFWSGSWTQDFLPLTNVPGAGDVTGQSQVWLAFLFESDSSASSDKGVLVDDIVLTKRKYDGTVVAGAVSGTWTPEKNPYIVPLNVGVVKEDSLVIEPGVEVRFEEKVEFVVLGLLKAVGTPTDSILFTSNLANPSPGDWMGLGFYSSISEGTTVQFSRIQYGGGGGSFNGGIFTDSGKLLLKHNLITLNKGAGIFCGAGNSIIENSIIENTTGVSTYLASPLVKRNLIKNNRTGVSVSLSVSPLIIENEIVDNTQMGVSSNTTDVIVVKNIIARNGSDGVSAGGGAYYIPSYVQISGNQIFDNGGDGISLGGLVASARISTNLIEGNELTGIDFARISGIYENPGIEIVNNTIVKNDSTGIYCGNKLLTRSKFINNIIYANRKSGIYAQNARFFSIRFNNVSHNHPDFNLSTSDSLGIFTYQNSNGVSSDKYFNISEDPLFVDKNNRDFHLQNTSPCVNAGNPNVFFHDFDGSINDLGFYGGGLFNIRFSEYHFGRVAQGSSRETYLRIENYRDSPVALYDFQIDEARSFSVAQNDTLKIEPYQSENVKITFTPQGVAKYRTELMINSNDFNGTDLAEITLQGEGINGTDAKGTVSGVWRKSGSPYILSGSVTIPEGKKLKIEPGVEIRFDGAFTFGGRGTLEAIGTKNDSIIFTRHRNAANSEGFGIRFSPSSTSPDTSKLIYCVIEKMQKIYDVFGRVDMHAIYLWKSSPVLIANSRISNNAGPTLCGDKSTLIIKNSVISNNAEDAICFKSTTGEVSGCTIINNGGIGLDCRKGGFTSKKTKIAIKNNFIKGNQNGGISLSSTNAEIFNNIITENSASKGAGIYFASDTLRLINNTIYKNSAQNSGGGLYKSRNPLIAENNIFWGNEARYGPQVYSSYSSTTALNYSLVQGGYDGVGNIAAPPHFLDPENDLFHLQSNSPAIDAGNPAVSYNDVEDPNRVGFALAPSQGTIRNDMGAFGGPGVAGNFINHAPQEFSLLSPADGDTIDTLLPTFIWNQALDSDPNERLLYSLQIDSDQPFAEPINYSGLADTTYTLTEGLAEGATYYWKVTSTDAFGLQAQSTEIFRFTIPLGTAVAESIQLPTHFDLSQNYPNPFNPQTTIKYQLPKAAEVKLTIYNLLGQRVATLVDKQMPEGFYSVQWDGKDDAGRSVASGIYVYALRAGDFAQARKMILTR
ncbi:MAG: right-handed parallel beta-helix repeat-containing protein [bacterium]